MAEFPSLLMALLADQYGEETIGEEINRWMNEGAPKERKELMLQALYEALPYAFKDERAARAVGRLLARNVGGTADPPPKPADLQALRNELREELKNQYIKMHTAIEGTPPSSQSSGSPSST